MSTLEQVLAKVAALSQDDQHTLLEFIETLSSAKNRPCETAPPKPARPAGIWEKMHALAAAAEQMPTDLPVDLAANHDFYLHGLPKRS